MKSAFAVLLLILPATLCLPLQQRENVESGIVDIVDQNYAPLLVLVDSLVNQIRNLSDAIEETSKTGTGVEVVLQDMANVKATVELIEDTMDESQDKTIEEAIGYILSLTPSGSIEDDPDAVVVPGSEILENPALISSENN